MATVVNNPPQNNGGNGMGMVFGAIVLLLIVVLFFVYGLPALRSASSPQVNVPSEIDVNVSDPSQQ